MTTVPALGAWIGVPAGLRKSAPACGLRALPLKMLRVPNALLAGSDTGRANAPFPQTPRRGVFPRAAQKLVVARDPFGGGWRRRDEGFVHRQLPRAKLFRRHDELVGGLRSAGVDRDGVASRLRVKVDPDQYPPRAIAVGERHEVVAERRGVNAIHALVERQRQDDEFAGLDAARRHGDVDRQC
jgi:hypothetical protein